ncbi:MAG: DUF1858 domain-containing protein [Firmicutes bacterium]|nr:DUF1858 domain-containing protein [Bacillota bacterium]MCL5039817.1 DUF1858 domain-containing protein [Bacillota bacterium]
MDRKITREMTIAQVLKLNPRSYHVLLRFGMFCMGCEIAHGERLDQAAIAHGVEIGRLLEELNRAQ